MEFSIYFQIWYNISDSVVKIK